MYKLNTLIVKVESNRGLSTRKNDTLWHLSFFVFLEVYVEQSKRRYRKRQN